MCFVAGPAFRFRMYSAQDVCFHRGKVFFIDERERGNPIEFEVPVFSIDFLLVDGILRKRKRDFFFFFVRAIIADG